MSFHNPFDLYSDSRSHATPGPSRNTRLQKVTLPGGGFISKGEDGRIAVAGRESLRILRVLEASQQTTTVDPKHATRPAFRIESTKNLWEGSNLKVDCASTDVAWAYGAYNNKILTSARNGDLIMWDLVKSGHSKFERKAKDHMRSIHAVTVSRVVHHYCVTGSADGDFRIWDLRDIQSSVMRVHNPSAVRRLAFSPCVWNPLFILVGMDNGTLHRWDLKMGQRGLLDRLPVAHTAPITTMDWYSGGEEPPPPHAIAISNPPYMPDDYTGNTLGWVATAGLDHCVKIWNLTGPDAGTRMPNKPTYTLHTSYPIRRVLWRPGYECELAVVSQADFTHLDHLHPSSSSSPSPPPTLSGVPQSRLTSRPSSGLGLDSILKNFGTEFKLTPKEVKPLAMPPPAAAATVPAGVPVVDKLAPVLDAVEVWDVRRSWIPKWSVTGTSVEGGVTDIEFAEPHVLLAQNMNGTFTQIDMRDISKPLDAIPRTSTTWTPQGALAFITDHVPSWEIPYDDIHPARLNSEPSVLTTTKPVTTTKRIGDRPFRPKTQKLGTFSLIQDHLEAVAFGKIACSYVIDGNDRPALCAINTQVAIAAGKPHIAQIWMLMKSSLTNYIPSPPPTPPQSPPTRVASSLNNNNFPRHTTPTSALASYTFPQTAAAASASTSRSPDVLRQRGTSPSFPFPVKLGSSGSGQQQQHRRRSSPSSNSQKPTPVSSNSSSPLHLSSTLPAPITPRRASFLGPPRRESMGSSSARRRSSILLLRRQSLSSPAHAQNHYNNNASPIDKSVKNAGEGVLSDSDSGSDNEDEEEEGDDDVVDSSDDDDDDDDEETDRLPGVIGNVIPTSVITTTPSPLSRLPERPHWTEMEEEEEDDVPSPSPGSTDTESEGEEGEGEGEGEGEEGQKNSMSLAMQRSPSLLNKSRKNSRGKTRSRSSTLASLPAGPPPRLSSSTRYQSQSSIRTVTPAAAAAAETSFQASDHHPTPVDAGRESGSRSRGKYGVVNRERYDDQQQQLFEESMSVVRADRVTARRADMVVAEEGQMLEYCWEVLRGAFEEFVLAGDVQTAATMAVIAPEELGLSLRRRLHIFDAYIDQLLKYQLYTTAAYFRKHSKVQQIKNVTLLDTTLYTACGRCKKSLNKPFGSFPDGSWKRPTFNYCRGCKAPTVTCTICRLPVRNMLFQCSICRHGGHQSCYRQFYLNQPMVDLPPAYTTAENESRGRSSTRTGSALHEFVNRSESTVGADDYYPTPVGGGGGGGGGNNGLLMGAMMVGGELVGHPCAAGCGHFCWAALKQA